MARSTSHTVVPRLGADFDPDPDPDPDPDSDPDSEPTMSVSFRGFRG